MILKIYAIKDTVVGAYMQPFYLHNNNEAKRAFANAVNDEKSEANKTYKDLQLWCLGTYNNETGLIESKIEYIMNGIEAKGE